MDYRELVNLGLSEKESKIYLASLELGKETVQSIAEKGEINRATAYVIIDGLMKKGLMSSITEGKKQYFMAESPEKLNLLFKEQEQAIKRREEYLQKLMPELRAMESNKKDRPTVRYYEGKKGMINVIEEFYITPQKLPAQMIYSEELLRKIFTENEIRKFRKKRINKKVKTEVILSSIKDKPDKVEFSDRIKIDKKEFPVYADVALFGNKTRLFSFERGGQGIIIENKEITDTLRTLFKLARIGAKTVLKKKSRKS